MLGLTAVGPGMNGSGKGHVPEPIGGDTDLASPELGAALEGFPDGRVQALGGDGGPDLDVVVKLSHAGQIAHGPPGVVALVLPLHLTVQRDHAVGDGSRHPVRDIDRTGQSLPGLPVQIGIQNGRRSMVHDDDRLGHRRNPMNRWAALTASTTCG